MNFFVSALFFTLSIQNVSAQNQKLLTFEQFTPEFEDIQAPPADPKKSLEDHWKDVGLTFQRVQNELKTSNCYKSEIKFFGCFAAVNGALSGAGHSMLMVPSDRLATLKYKYTLGTQFGQAQIITINDEQDPAPENQTLSDVIAKLRAERTLTREYIKNLYKISQSNKINFEAIGIWLNNDIVTHSNEHASLITSEAINGFLGAHDPHTYIEPTAYLEAEHASSESSFVGIGVFIQSLNGKIFISRPIEGSPALAAGIKAKDEIIEVDGVALVPGVNTKEIINSIAGVEGTVVKIKIKRGDKILSFSITRAKVVQKNVSYSILTDSNMKTGYIKLRGFMSESGCNDIQNAIKSLESSKVLGIILDLRGNGGGLLDQAVCMGGLFVGRNKTIVTAKFTIPGYSNQTVRSTNEQVTKLPLITLIDAGSASASEVLSGALQDYQRALVMGDRSFGKATVQAVMPLHEVTPDMSPLSPATFEGAQEQNQKTSLALTIARFFLPSDRTNQIVGIQPDVQVYAVPNPTENDKISQREEDLYANSLPAIGAPFVQKRPEYVAKIQSCMNGSGNALKLYNMRQNDAIPPDYQILSAEDAMACMVAQ